MDSLKSKNNSILQKMVEDYVNPDIPRKIEFTNLLEEFRNYSPEIFKAKAFRVHRKCIKAKKLNLADKIRIKYRLDNYPCDACMAFGLALIASKQIKQQLPKLPNTKK